MTGPKTEKRISRHKTPDPTRTAALCEQLRTFDHGLMKLVETYQGDMTLKAAGELVAMHRKLRRMRYQIEAEVDLGRNEGGRK